MTNKLNNGLNQIEKCGKEVIRSSSKRLWKYPFRKIWLNNLKEYYTNNKSVNKINLEDFPNNFRIVLNEKGKRKLKELYKNITPYSNEGCKYIHSYIMSISVFTLKNILNRNNVKLNSFEEFIIGIKIRNSKILYIKRFPIRFDTKEICTILGLFPDLDRKNLRSSFKERYLSDKLKNSITKGFGEIDVNVNVGSNFLSTLIGLSGLRVSENQLEMNNPIPFWLFYSDISLIKSYISSLFDAEGSPNKKAKSIYLAQGVIINKKLKTYSKPKKFSKFNIKEKEVILNNPPLLLISTLLLLKKQNIESRIRPRVAYKRKIDDINITTWTLEIYGYKNLYKFYNNLNFDLPRKKKILLDTINSYKRMLRQRNEGYNQALRKLVELKYSTRKHLSERLNRSIYTADYFIKLMKKEGHMKVHHKIGKTAYFSATTEGINFNNKMGVLVDDNNG